MNKDTWSPDDERMLIRWVKKDLPILGVGPLLSEYRTPRAIYRKVGLLRSRGKLPKSAERKMPERVICTPKVEPAWDFIYDNIELPRWA